ncbi:MAG TPA: GrpB family protein, partial [Aquella sp.]|nr:GrpB family protein [Aquella sp.]
MIILEAYNAEWPVLFEREKALILSAAKAYNIMVEHIGSTAIPGIKAKPIIDIMVGVQNLAIADQYIVDLIQSLGYNYISEYEKNMPERRYFEKAHNN